MLGDSINYKRHKVYQRMCIFAAVMSLVALAAIMVGAFAVQSSDSNFPFNAGGAIIAGITTLLLSVCTMCMYTEKNGRDGTVEPVGEGCCGLVILVWGLLTLLGIVFGFVVNGVVVVNVCVHPSEETGCVKNSSAKLTLGIVTIVVTFILMALTLLICCTCWRHIYKEHCVPGYGDSPRVTRRARAQNNTYQISGSNHSRGLSGRYANSGSSDGNSNLRYNLDSRSTREPTAPTQYWNTAEIENSRVLEPTAPPQFRGTVDMNNGRHEDATAPPRYWSAVLADNGSRGAATPPPQYWSAVNADESRARGFNDEASRRATSHEHGQQQIQTPQDPPPTYYEAMENDPMETPL